MIKKSSIFVFCRIKAYKSALGTDILHILVSYSRFNLQIKKIWKICIISSFSKWKSKEISNITPWSLRHHHQHLKMISTFCNKMKNKWKVLQFCKMRVDPVIIFYCIWIQDLSWHKIAFKKSLSLIASLVYFASFFSTH